MSCTITACNIAISTTAPLQIQLASPTPYDLDEIELAEYKELSPRWQQWSAVVAQCTTVALDLFDSAR